MQVEVSLSRNKSTLKVKISNASWLMIELYEFIEGGNIYCHSPLDYNLKVDRLNDIERELFMKWNAFGSSKDKLGIEFLSLTSPIYSHEYAISLDRVETFVERLRQFILAEIFLEKKPWSDLKFDISLLYASILNSVENETGLEIDKKPLEAVFCLPLSRLPLVTQFIRYYRMPTASSACYSCSDSRVGDNILQLMDYNRDMDYSFRSGNWPLALCVKRAAS